MASAWTNMKTWTAGEVVGESDFNTYIRDNMTFLKNPPFEQLVTGSNTGIYSSTASTAVPISTADIQITLTTYGGNVNVYFCAPMVGGRIALGLFVDGTGFNETVRGLTWRLNADTESANMQYNVWVTGLASGSHTFTPNWKSTGQEIDLPSSGTPIVFWVREG